MNKDDYVHSDVTGKYYIPSKVVRIVNILQSVAYLNNGAQLLDIYPSKDYKTGKPILVFIFNRQDTKNLYDLWCRHELTYEVDENGKGT